jgi:hypothetical protein
MRFGPQIRSFPDESLGATTDDRAVTENQDFVMRMEVVLRSSGAEDEVRFHSKRLSIGDVIQTGTDFWRVVDEEPPADVGIQARYICARAQSAEVGEI